MEKDDNSVTWHLSLRIERPIQGCELSPHPYLKIKAPSLDNSARAKLLDATPHTFTFQWSRGIRRQICENRSCPRCDTFDPVCWSRFALGGPGLQCTVCEKAGVPRYLTIFCSTQCFKSAWKQHSTKHQFLKDKLVRKRSPSVLELAKDAFSEREVDECTDNNTSSGDYIEGVPVNAIVELTASDTKSPEWTPICNEKYYSPTAEDVGCTLRIECRVIDGSGGLLTTPVVLHTEPVLCMPTPPPKRSMITIPGAASVSADLTGRLRVVTYNVLSDLYATRQAYPYSDAWNLAWPYRRSLLLQELEDAQADVLCLQEVQADHFESHLLPALSRMGYEGVYKQKTRESMGSAGKVDGCALLWKQAKLTLVEKYAVEFNEVARQLGKKREREGSLDKDEASRLVHRLSKDNVAQIVVLELIGATSRLPSGNGSRGRPGNQICLVNTHIYANPKLVDVKLWQTVTLMNEVESHVGRRDIPTVICGDFNSEPHSAVYQFLTHGRIDPNHEDIELTGSFSAISDPSAIAHNLHIESAMITAAGNEPSFTNFTVGFIGTLDYIWYTPSNIRVLAAMSLPEADEIYATSEGLPSPNRPSDHVMLCVDIAVMSGSNGGLVGNNTSQNSLKKY